MIKSFIKAPVNVRLVIIATITVTPVISPKLKRFVILANINTKNPELSTTDVMSIARPVE